MHRAAALALLLLGASSAAADPTQIGVFFGPRVFNDDSLLGYNGDKGPDAPPHATLNNSIERCANDEEDAHGKLRTLWADFSAADKERCEAVTRAAWPSYVELLACLQIAQATNGIGARLSDDDKKSDSPAAQEVIDRATSPSSAITARTATGRSRATISRAHRRPSVDQRRVAAPPD
jgi:hypothetical protein